MVFTSWIEVLGVKPDLYFSFVINSFHKDLFSEGDPRGSSISKRDILLFSEEPARTTTGAFLAGAFFFQK